MWTSHSTRSSSASAAFSAPLAADPGGAESLSKLPDITNEGGGVGVGLQLSFQRLRQLCAGLDHPLR